ncbi:MAG: hypothetical protein JWR02_710 [Mucilaginibacter sp.]|nr:hypothetical protein [Mucilaginibacter sp.]
MNKKISLWLVLLLLWISFIITITFGWAVWHIKSNGPLFKGKTSSVIISIATFPSLVKETFLELGTNPLVKSNLYPSINGFKVERKYIDSNYILLSVYDKKADQSIIKLMRIYDQKIIYEWTPNFDEIKKSLNDKNKFWETTDKHTIFLLHPLLSPDGSITFHAGNPLIKINKESKLVWVIDGIFHHSLEFDSDGNVWSPAVIKPSKFLPNFLVNYKDDAIAKISSSGKLLFEKSIAEILVQNGYRGLLLGVGFYENDALHLNDIQPALNSTQYWRRGDLLISLRHKSTVFLYRPSADKILWLKTGPWLNQHDVDFVDSNRIGVFGNNMVRMDLEERLIDGHNEEYVYNFKTDKTETPYTEFLKKAGVSTLSEGRSDILPNGDLFIEETNKNRLLRGSEKNIIWQYVDHIDQHSIAALQWSRFITKEEFKKLTFLQKNNTL